jgi:axial budding pattern protein 2
MALIVALIALAFLVAVNAELWTQYPINSQLPPVARVSKPYQFTFSAGTFGGVQSSTIYSLVNAPSWLRVDSASHTLSGTPGKDDEGTAKFQLVASDTGNSASMDVTLIVTTDDGPQPGTPLLPQLEAIGATSAPSTILIHSGDSFSISFDSSTFTNTRPSTVYYGTSPENAPLPSWVTFDQASLRFSGAAPNIGPQTFNFNLVASDVAGFSAATMSFNMTISPHILAFNDSTQTFFVNQGKEFTTPDFVDSLTLDGNTPAASDLTGVNAESPEWLKLNKDTISLSGTPSDDATDANVTISVTDKYNDVATLILSLKFSQFFKNLAECDAVIGEYFSFVFNDSVLTSESVQLDVNIGSQLPWLHYDASNKTLYGNVPSGLSPGKSAINITAREGTAEDSRQFTINTVDKGSSGNSSTGGSTSSGGGSSGNKAGIIAISVIIPVAFLLSLFLLCCCWRRKRRAAEAEDGQDGKEKDPSSGPDEESDLPRCQPYEETVAGVPPRMDRNPSPSKPPKLELGLWDENAQPQEERDGPERTRRENTLSTSTIEWDFAPLKAPEPDEGKQSDTSSPAKRRSFQSSTHVRKRTNSSHKREPLKPIQPRRSLKRTSMQSTKSRRLSKRSSGISPVATGLPIRISGAGHGAGGFGPPGHGIVRVSWQNTNMSLQSDENSVGNLAPLFPRPPRARDSLEYPKFFSLRAVEPDTLTASETDSLEAFVHSRAKHRNSSNPLFSGQLSRRTSSGIRALERARSNASRADTIGSSNSNDDYRRSMHERWSAALSASIYTDDNRQSTWLDSLSEESFNVRPLAPLVQKPSQSSLAQNYTASIGAAPPFLSDSSLDVSAQKARNHGDRGSSDIENMMEERPAPADHRRRSKTNPYPQSDNNPFPLPKSPSTSSVPLDGKPRRISLIQLEANGQGRLQREQTGSMRSDIAFV